MERNERQVKSKSQYLNKIDLIIIDIFNYNLNMAI